MDSGWWAVVVAVVAALFAAWQAWEARRARTDAQSARDEAGDHERAALTAARESADAATRGAEAQERIAAVTERQAQETTTWSFRHLEGERWSIVNATNTVVLVRLALAGDEAFLRLTTGPSYQLLGPDEGLEVLWPDQPGLRQYAQVWISWGEHPDGEMRGERLTLRRKDGARLL